VQLAIWNELNHSLIKQITNSQSFPRSTSAKRGKKRIKKCQFWTRETSSKNISNHTYSTLNQKCIPFNLKRKKPFIIINKYYYLLIKQVFIKLQLTLHCKFTLFINLFLWSSPSTCICAKSEMHYTWWLHLVFFSFGTIFMEQFALGHTIKLIFGHFQKMIANTQVSF